MNQDHVNAIPKEMYAGRVPAWLIALQMSALGISPIGFRRDGSPIWPMAGGASMRIADLDAFRSVEEYATYQTALDARIQELNDQYRGQPFPVDVQPEWAELGEIQDEIPKRLTELNARLARVSRLGSDDRHVERAEEPVKRTSNRRHVPEDIFAIEQYRTLSRSPEEESDALRDGALMAIDRATFPHERADADAIRADLHKLFTKIDDPDALSLIVLGTGKPAYQQGFFKNIAGQRLYPDEQRALREGVRAQSLGTGSAGGDAVPFQLDPTLILTSDGVTNPIRAISRVERITGREWQGITSAGVTASYTATEGGVAPDKSLVLAQPKVATVEASAFVEYSITIDLAWGALQSELARAFQDAKDVLEAEKFVNGSGVGEPAGLVSTLAPSSNVFIGSSFGVEDVFNLKSHGINHLPPRFQAGASFLGNGAIYDDIRMLSVGTVGQGAVWADSLQEGSPNRLLGKPAYEESEMDADSSLHGSDVLVYGNFVYFLIVDRIGLTIEIVQHTIDQASGRPKTSRGALAYWMNNTLILTSNAFRKLRKAGS